MQTLAVAIREERWDTVALILLEAVIRVTSQVPSDAVQGLLEALEGLQAERDTYAS